MKKIILFSLLVIGTLMLVSCGTGQAVQFPRSGTTSACIQLSCIGIQNSLLEGESKTYTVAGLSYNVGVYNFLYQAYAGGVQSVKFKVNSESFELLVGESYVLPNGAEITLKEMLYQSYAGGIRQATFRVVAP